MAAVEKTRKCCGARGEQQEEERSAWRGGVEVEGRSGGRERGGRGVVEGRREEGGGGGRPPGWGVKVGSSRLRLRWWDIVGSCCRGRGVRLNTSCE